MELIELEELLKRPEVLREILGNYRGPYAMGIARSEGPWEGHQVLLRVPDEQIFAFKESIRLGDKTIPILVRRGYREPRFF